MQSIKTAFSRAANGFVKSKPGLTVIWLMVVAIAILDESGRSETDRQPQPAPARKPPAPTP